MVRASMIAIAAAIAVNIAVGTPAKAIEWPWCADLFGGEAGGTATNCGFASWQQCESYLSGMSGWCYTNPFYRTSTRSGRRSGRRNR